MQFKNGFYAAAQLMPVYQVNDVESPAYTSVALVIAPSPCGAPFSHRFQVRHRRREITVNLAAAPPLASRVFTASVRKGLWGGAGGLNNLDRFR
jgi:hypothetical protein